MGEAFRFFLKVGSLGSPKIFLSPRIIVRVATDRDMTGFQATSRPEKETMKPTLGVWVLLAGLGGCMQTQPRPQTQIPPPQGIQTSQKPVPFGQATQYKDASQYVGPSGEPIQAYTPRGAMPGQAGVYSAGYVAGNNIVPADLMRADMIQNSGAGSGIRQVLGGGPPMPPGPPPIPQYRQGGGIVPVPGMGPAGAVAAIGALPRPAPMMPLNARTSVRFQDPEGMKVTWYGPHGWNDTPLTTKARYNFLQGGIYRLKLSQIPNKPDLGPLYPTLEVVPATQKTATFLAHSSVPVSFSDDDLEQVGAGNFLVKVIYLPDPAYQDFAVVAGPNELVSSRLEPGQDPIIEAQKRGTILLIIRMGNINLEDHNTPAMDAPNPYMMVPRAPARPMGPNGAPILPQPRLNPAPGSKEPPKADAFGRPLSLPVLQ